MILIKNAKLSSELISEILIEESKIKEVAQTISIDEDIKVIDAKGLYVLPGLVDLNVRLANSLLSTDSLKKLTQSSLKGGVTTSVIMPDFAPRLDNSTLLEHFKLKADMEEASLHVAAPLVNEESEKLNNVATLLNNGTSAIWTTSFSNANLLKRGFQYARMKKAPIFCQCYDPNLDDSGVMNEGVVSAKLGLPGISKVSENAEVAKVAELSLINNTKIIFQTLSTTRAINIIDEIKKINKNIFTEVSVHHLSKNDESCDGFNTYAKIFPPLRDEKEREGLIKALQEGKIDALTSAHSPKSVLYKDVAFENAEFGIGALEEYLSLCYTYLVKSGIISMQRLEELCATNPAEILAKENIGQIKAGYNADLVFFDPETSYILEDKTSLYFNNQLFGKVKQVIKDGVLLAQ